jgi:hypothetical protein
VKPQTQPGAIAFDVLGLWTTITLTSAKKGTISGLTLGGIYQFQIRALGKLGYTDWMDTPKTSLIHYKRGLRHPHSLERLLVALLFVVMSLATEDQIRFWLLPHKTLILLLCRLAIDLPSGYWTGA